MPSHPRPVPAGKVKSASRNWLSEIGSREAVSLGHSSWSASASEPHWIPYLTFSTLAAYWAPTGVPIPLEGVRAALSCCCEMPSSSSSSDRLVPT